LFTIKESAKIAISVMDLTSLNDNDTVKSTKALARRAHTPAGNVSALCIWPRFIPWAKVALEELGFNNIRLATVSNFPYGEANLDIAKAETLASIAYGANEVDLVFPWRAFKSGDSKIAKEIIKECRKICKDSITLKVIIESGELKEPKLIRQASEISIECGANFIKTSTGKVPINATLEASRVILETIKESKMDIGFKVAGGVKNAQDAKEYLDLTATIMGKEWIEPKRFRFGASSLLDNLLQTLGYESNSNSNSNY